MCSSGSGNFSPRQIVFVLCGLLIAIANPSPSCGIQNTSPTAEDKDRFLIGTGTAKIIQSHPEETANTKSQQQEPVFRTSPHSVLVPLPTAIPAISAIPGNGITANLTDQTGIGTTNTPHDISIETSQVQTATYSFNDSTATARPTIAVPSLSNHVTQSPKLASRPVQPLEPKKEPRIDAMQQMKQGATNLRSSATTQLSSTASNGSRLNDNRWQENLSQTKLPQTNPPQANLPQTNPPQTNLSQTNLPQTNPPQTNLPQTNLPQTNPPQTNLSQTNLPQTNPPQTNVAQITAESREFDIKNQLLEHKPRLATNNLDWNAAIAAARQLESQEKYHEALKMYHSLSQRSDVPAIVYHRLAVLMDKTGQGDALPIYHKALAADPNSADLYADLGYRNQLLGDPTNAYYYYRQALVIDPGHSRAHINLGTLLLQDGQAEDVAIDHFRKAGLSWIRAKQNVRLITACQ